MKSTVACLLLAFVGLSSAITNVYPRGIQQCPVGTISYTVDRGYVTSEATCRNPRPKPDKQLTSGYSACHCARPTVRNEATGQCVHLDHCPQARIIHGHGGGVKKIEIRQVDKNHFKRPTAPVAPVAPTAPVKPFAPIPPALVAPTAPVAPTVPLYNGYNPNTGYVLH